MQIYQAQRIHSNQQIVNITQEEQQKFEQASRRIREIQQEAEPKMEQDVKDVELNVERFNQIFAAIKRDSALQQKVQ